MPTKFVFDEKQRFDCRECPARCCKLPVAIPLNTAEIARLSSEPWVHNRLGDTGMAWIAKGVIPTREVDRLLQCAFLDGDGLCSMQKQFGHDFLPQTCRSFPFGFVRNDNGQLVAQMSKLCPSIRDNYGDLVTVKRLANKLKDKGGEERMSKAMATRHGQILNQKQYLQVVERWLDRLKPNVFPANALLALYDWTLAFEDAVPQTAEKPSNSEVAAALNKADDRRVVPFSLVTGAPWQARMFHAYILGGLSYPSRVTLPHRVDSPLALVGVRSLWGKMKWMLCRGSVDLLYIKNSVPLGKVEEVHRFLSTDRAHLISALLRHVIERRQIFRDPRHMMEVLIDLVLCTVVISRYARCAAASEGRIEVRDEDVLDGISVAELALLGHASQRKAGTVMRNIRRMLIADREMFLRMLASENNEV